MIVIVNWQNRLCHCRAVMHTIPYRYIIVHDVTLGLPAIQIFSEQYIIQKKW